jgi:2-methylcitrate dehydratase PrpD
MTDVATLFVDRSLDVRGQGLDEETRKHTAEFILDTLAVGLSGSSAAGIAEALAYVRATGGSPQAHVLVFGDQVPVESAALVNGVQLAARDFDPIYEPGVLLPYAPIVAAALATAEHVDASGAQFVTAVAIGADLTCRLGRSLTTGLAWSRTATLSTFGAALASGWLRGLERDELLSTLGLALSQAAGNIQTVVEGTLAKRYQAGFAARSATLSAQLAARGVTGPHEVFEGRFGYMTLYESGGYERDVLVDGIGEVFEGARCTIKPYPCAREHHAAIAAALELAAEGVEAGDVTDVTVSLPPNAFSLSGGELPADAQLTVGRSLGSAAFGVASAIVHGRVDVTHFEPDALTDRRVRELAARTAVIRDDSIADAIALVPQTVTMRLTNGATRSRTISALQGSPDNPLTRADLLAKAHRCAATCEVELDPAGTAAFFETVLRAESLRHATALFAALDNARR